MIREERHHADCAHGIRRQAPYAISGRCCSACVCQNSIPFDTSTIVRSVVATQKDTRNQSTGAVADNIDLVLPVGVEKTEQEIKQR